MTVDVAWKRPIQISISSEGKSVEISSTSQAAWLLADQWPGVDGKWFSRALRACADSIEGKGTVERARRSLALAAREANLKVGGVKTSKVRQ
jgi:hypothetical protein